jgi:hypothetical protein
MEEGRREFSGTPSGIGIGLELVDLDLRQFDGRAIGRAWIRSVRLGARTAVDIGIPCLVVGVDAASRPACVRIAAIRVGFPFFLLGVVATRIGRLRRWCLGKFGCSVW